MKHYVLNRVLVTKPYDKNPYELLTGDKLSISYLKPFGYHLTILNTSDPLGKFDKKSDEGTGQAWMFDIDYLTDSLNYSRVSSTNLTAGSQSATPCTAVVPIVDEATTQNNGTEEADHLGLAFPSLNLTLGIGSASIGSFISAGSTPPVSAGSTPAMSLCASPISVDRHSISAGKCHVFVGRPSGSADRTPVPANIHDGLKIFDCPKSGIFTSSSYDEEFTSELTTVAQALTDPDWVEAMQAEMQQFRNQKVWVLVTLPDGKRAIVCTTARHQVTPKTSNLLSVKQIFKYLIAYPKLGLWYPRDSPFDLEAFSDSNYAGANGDRKSTTGGCQFLGRRDANEKKLIQDLKIPTEHNVADLLTKCFDVIRFSYLVVNIVVSIHFCWSCDFLWLFPIPAGYLVSAGHMLFLL
nr:putative ribonuclease H-like domain-containing protein [Tanacetum cinerariifolium]